MPDLYKAKDLSARSSASLCFFVWPKKTGPASSRIIRLFSVFRYDPRSAEALQSGDAPLLTELMHTTLRNAPLVGCFSCWHISLHRHTSHNYNFTRYIISEYQDNCNRFHEKADFQGKAKPRSESRFFLAPGGAFLRFMGYIFVIGITAVCGNCSFTAWRMIQSPAAAKKKSPFLSAYT